MMASSYRQGGEYDRWNPGYDHRGEYYYQDSKSGDGASRYSKNSPPSRGSKGSPRGRSPRRSPKKEFSEEIVNFVKESSLDNPRSPASGGEGGSGKRRRSRWEPQPEADGGSDKETKTGTGTGGKKRKSRWAAEEPNNPNVFGPEMQALHIKYLDLTRRMQMNIFEDRGEQRSPSPEPVYDNCGMRVNTREARAREKLTKERHALIAEMMKRFPSYKPPADYKPPKIQKKLYIPAKEYPGYNFIGLIIGPRGNTQKRMEKETGAKIVIRGKGSVKEGRTQQKRDVKPDPSENEDLHVLVEAETEEALNAAADMVEKLLLPVEEGRNEHKRAQLRELAALNGTIRDDESCRQCGQLGHRQYCCPEKSTIFKAGVVCAKCGDGGHPTSDCTQKGPVPGNNMDMEYSRFLTEVNANGAVGEGGGIIGRQAGIPSLMINGPPGAAVPPPGLLKKEHDDTNLYVGYLPQNYDDESLRQLFEPFGQLEEVKVIRDRATGVGKGYGFVKFVDITAAAQAIHNMNHFKLEDKQIVVKVAGPVSRGPFGMEIPPPAGAYPFPARPPMPQWGTAPPHYDPYASQYLAPPGTIPPPPPPPYNAYGPPGVSYGMVDPAPPPPGFSPPHSSSAQDPYSATPAYHSGYYPPAPPPWASASSGGAAISASAASSSTIEPGENKPGNGVEAEYARFMSEIV